jgi:ferredoxin
VSNQHELTDKIRSKVRELFQAGEDPGESTLSCFIGYEEGTRGRVRPAFIYEPQDADRLIWDDRCTHNLAVYLPQLYSDLGRRSKEPGEKPSRVGILVKPCDSRSLNILFHEKQVERDRTYVIGLTCEGVRMHSLPTLRRPGNGRPEERCRRCSDRVPVVYDLVMGEVPSGRGTSARGVSVEGYANVARLEAMVPSERLAFWAQEFDRCIRCYACRQACPACYCYECTAEQLAPSWMSIAIDLPQKLFFHVMRAYHLAGRCSGCNACEEACPMQIPLSLLNYKIAQEVEDLFGYKTGQDAETLPPLATFVKEEELVM